MQTQYKLLIVEGDPIVQMAFKCFLGEVQQWADCVGTLEQAGLKLLKNFVISEHFFYTIALLHLRLTMSPWCEGANIAIF